MKTLRDWNYRQSFVMARYCRARTLAMTPELVTTLAIRFARKHGAERPAATGNRNSQLGYHP